MKETDASVISLFCQPGSAGKVYSSFVGGWKCTGGVLSIYKEGEIMENPALRQYGGV